MNIEDIKKVQEHRKHKVTGSIGVYQAYKWIRKNKWLDIGRPLTEHEFYSIVRRINGKLAEALSLGAEIKLPHRMGSLELRKTNTYVGIKDGKPHNNLPIDWDSTLKLWCEDAEAYNNKTLLKLEERERFKVIYNRANANYENKSFYQFKVNRELKKMLKHNIKEGLVDAFSLRT